MPGLTGLNKNIKKSVASLVKALSDRNRDVILRRFGLKTGRPETLESIGQSYGITRERVRQIEEYALKNLRSSGLEAASVLTRPYFDFTIGVLGENSGFAPENNLFKKFSGQTSENNVDNLSLSFLLSLHPDFHKSQENDEFLSFWFVNRDSSDLARELVSRTISVLNSKKKLLNQQGLYDLYKTDEKNQPVSLNTFLAALSLSKRMDQN
ncbi:MAG: sigma factor-like helix-turn-helix DNA-binding protein, partial [bacterium]|nr:sigma factor-like helix-turn-helix DNA-binding protein [bacterium]